MDWLSLAYACGCIFIAAIVRGFSGFGFSLLSITALSLAYAPVEIIPSIFLLEIAASLHLLPSVWKDVDWRSLMPLTLGCLLATPVGVYFLATIPPRPMQMALSIFVLLAVLLLWKGFALRRMPGTAASIGAGAASGLANGAFGMGGPPVILFYFASPAGNAVGRASMIMFFLMTDVVGIANQATQGMINQAVVLRALAYLPPLLAGIWLGSRSFKSTDPAKFRRWVLALLAVLAVVIGLRALFA